jgi:hypothetical protein
MEWRQRLLGIATAAVLAGAAIGVTACGGGDGAATEPAGAGTAESAGQPATEPDDEAALQELEDQVEKQGEEGPGKTDSKDSGDTGLTHCGGELSVGPNTSCPFGHNVRYAYESSGGASTVSAYSPVTAQTYVMDCGPGADVATVCTGGDNATVYFN